MVSSFIYKLFSFLPMSTKVRILDKIDLRTHLDYKIPIPLKFHSSWSYYRRNCCRKEPETIDWLENTLREDDVFLDIGANVGAYSYIAASIMKKGTVLCVEPSFSTFKTLCDNILHLKESFKDVAFIPFYNALGDNECMIDFNFSSISSGAGRHGGDSYEASLKTTSIKLDTLIKQFELPNPTVVKIDVDGPELDVIKGASQTFTDNSVRSVLVEVDNENSEAVNNLMYRYEFTIFSSHPRGENENRVYIKKI
jgi:FkbM family methyltransferase